MRLLWLNQYHPIKSIIWTLVINTRSTLIAPKRRNISFGIPQNQQQQLSKDSDYYSILNISPNASQKQIKAAYYKRSLVLHPDRNIGDSKQKNIDSESKFAELTEAYKILGNNQTRKIYDQKLKVRFQMAFFVTYFVLCGKMCKVTRFFLWKVSPNIRFI